MKYAILKVSPLFLVEMFKHDIPMIKLVDHALPEDTKYVRAFTDDFGGWGRIGLVLESESFRELKDGEMIPVLQSPTFEKM
jgi:hypothetical protein